VAGDDEKVDWIKFFISLVLAKVNVGLVTRVMTTLFEFMTGFEARASEGVTGVLLAGGGVTGVLFAGGGVTGVLLVSGGVTGVLLAGSGVIRVLFAGGGVTGVLFAGGGVVLLAGVGS
jgi:hypothetical protein